MKEKLDLFVNQRLPLPGLLAWGAALPDGTFHGNGYHDGFRPAQLTEFLKRLDDLSKKLSPAITEGVRFCWTFQLVRVYSVCSPEGATLMLFFRNEHRLPSDATFKVLTDFQQLKWTTEAEYQAAEAAGLRLAQIAPLPVGSFEQQNSN